MGSEKVVGITIVSQVIERAAGRILTPTTSAATGAMVYSRQWGIVYGDEVTHGPEGAADGTAEYGKEDQDAITLCKDPYYEYDEGGETGEAARDVDTSHFVTYETDERSSDCQANLECCADDAALVGSEADATGVVWERE
jgi:hypothetical protein